MEQELDEFLKGIGQSPKEIKEQKDVQLIENEKEKFLAQIKKTSPELLPFIEARLRQKDLTKRENKKKANSLAEVTKELLEGDYIVLDDENDESLSINDLLVARATANLIANKKTTFRDLNDAQKVIKDDTADNRGGFTLVLNTNGQDLGA